MLCSFTNGLNSIDYMFFTAFFPWPSNEFERSICDFVLIPAAVLFIGMDFFVEVCSTTSRLAEFAVPAINKFKCMVKRYLFDLNLVGGGFKRVADLLPFSHAVDATRAHIGKLRWSFSSLIWVSAMQLLFLQ
jgi:ABC-2 type transport system permease protein